MAIKAVQLRRGVWMFPAHEVPNVNVVLLGRDFVPVLREELVKWLKEQGLPDDIHSNDWTYYCYPSYGNCDFFFKNPDTALLFKLTWG